MPYDKQGQPITYEELSKLRANPAYRIIGRDRIKHVVVSTVWIGYDVFDSDKFLNGNTELLIFETLAYAYTDMNNEYGRRAYATEAEAIDGHKKMMEHVRKSIREEQSEKKIERWKQKYVK